MARHTTAPPARTLPAPTEDDKSRVNAALSAMRGLMSATLATPIPGKPAGPDKLVPGHPAESPTVRPPARPAVKPGKPGKPDKKAAPANGPRIAAGTGNRPENGRKGGATRSARHNGHILPAPITTTGRAYHGLDSAFRYFNAALFGGKLPDVVITMQRHKGSRGYFAGARFADTAAVETAGPDGKPAVDKSSLVDEIAMNPAQFKGRTTREVLSTLVHEMTHVEQHHFGKPSRAGYHNAEWGTYMDRVGLTPTDTGAEGGKRTGQSVTHMIVLGGPFDKACAAFFKSGGKVTLYGDKWLSADDAAKVKRKGASKTKYTCPCCGMNAWAKPDVRINCGECEEELEAESR